MHVFCVVHRIEPAHPVSLRHLLQRQYWVSVAFWPQDCRGGRESTQKEPMERKSVPVAEAGESSEGRGRPKPSPVGDARLCRQLWLGAVCPPKVSFVHPRVKGTFIPNEFGGSHFRSLTCLPKRPCPIRTNQIKPEMGPSSGIRTPSF